MITYKCKICDKKLHKPEDKTEIFWDNVQAMFDIFWKKKYIRLNDTTDEKKLKANLELFKMMCDYKCCSDECVSELKKRSGSYYN